MARHIAATGTSIQLFPEAPAPRVRAAPPHPVRAGPGPTVTPRPREHLPRQQPCTPSPLLTADPSPSRRAGQPKPANARTLAHDALPADGPFVAGSVHAPSYQKRVLVTVLPLGVEPTARRTRRCPAGRRRAPPRGAAQAEANGGSDGKGERERQRQLGGAQSRLWTGCRSSGTYKFTGTYWNNAATPATRAADASHPQTRRGGCQTGGELGLRRSGPPGPGLQLGSEHPVARRYVIHWC